MHIQCSRQDIKFLKKLNMKNKNWEDIEEVEPDEIDLEMLNEIDDPDCKEFVSEEEALKMLGL